MCPCHTLAGHGPQQGVIVAENKGGEDRKLADATCPGAWGQTPTCLSVLCGVTRYEFLEDPEALPPHMNGDALCVRQGPP